MYGALRFISENYITSASMITASSWATGRVSGTSKSGEGSALMEVSGTYAGAYDLAYLLEIDSVTAGTEIGQATFKWRNSLTSGSWEETGVLTRTSPAYALSADGLSTGLSVSHTGAIGNDFALGDSWQWDARATYGPGNLLDRNRMTTWRSSGTSATLTINLGSAQTPDVALLLDHNLTSSATVKLQGNASDSWTSPSFSYTFSSITDALLYYFTTTENFTFWQWDFADPTNPDGYIEIANMLIGPYLQLNQINANWGSAQVNGAVLQNNESESGVMRSYYHAKQRRLNLDMGNVLSNDDIALILDLQDELIDTTTKQVKPLFVHLFADETDTLKLMRWVNLGTWSHEYFAYLLNSGVTFELAEVVKI